ncbi:MAG: DUF4430 domain-containing protein [Candidatus Magasanikbacteria bacterium]|nr:DUF4430 domain-containing protein [Candidatus Magasanikbacteria bacterium]
MTFVRHHKHHLGAFVILIIIAAVSGYFAFKTPNADNTSTPQQNNTTTDEIISNQPNETVISNQSFPPEAGQPLAEVISDETAPTTTTLMTQLLITNDSSVTNDIVLRVNGEEYKHKFVSSATVLDLMKELQFEHQISFSGKDYPGMGMFVEEINGVKNDNQANKYWIYYINGQSAQVGISNYIIKPNDLIEWKYETPNL